MAFVIETFAGDSAPGLTFTITRSDGSIVDLTGCTVSMVIQHPHTGKPTNNQTGGLRNQCTITDPVNGVCTYAWNAGGTDVPIPGIYNATIIIQYPDSSKETYPGVISALEPIKGAIIS
jgi:hypothetical protein